MTNQLTPRQRSAKWAFWTKLILLAVTGVVVAPFIGLAIQGIVGLIAVAAIGSAVIFLAQPVGQMMANLRLKMIKAESARNPVETLQNEYMRKKDILDSNFEKITSFAGKVKSTRAKIEKYRDKYPAEYKLFAEKVNVMDKALEAKVTSHRNATIALDKYEAEIEKAGDIWEMTQSLAEATDGEFDLEGDFYSKLKSETAYASIEDSMNKEFATLEIQMALRVEEPVAALK
jgi:hypothetical protein